MKRLVLLEWREISRDLRSWLVALLPVFLFSFARTLAPADQGSAAAFHELVDFGLAALALEVALAIDCVAWQRDRGELELLLLLPLSPARILGAKLAAILVPTFLLEAVQLLWALLLRSASADSAPAAPEDVARAAAFLFAATLAAAVWSARIALSGRTLRNASAKLLVWTLFLIGVSKSALLFFPDRFWAVVAALLAFSAAGFRSLLGCWNRPERWLVR